MPRFTDEQLNFQDGMEELFKLYYLLLKHYELHSARELNDMPSEVASQIAKLFYKTIPGFSHYQYYPSKLLFRFGRNAQISIRRRNFDDFLRMMDALQADLLLGRIKPDTVSVERIHYDVIRILETDRDYKDREYNKKAKPTFKWHLPKTEPKYGAEYLPVGDVILDSTEESKEAVGQSPPYSEVIAINLKPGSFFSRMMHVRVREFEPFANPQDSAETSFIAAIRYIFIKFVQTHGSLDRIKVCLNCKRFFLERKSNSQKFCQNESKCEEQYKKKFAKQNKYMATCRRRQNEWLRYTFENHEAFADCPEGYVLTKVNQKDCMSACDEARPVTGGMCAVLRIKNDPLFRRLEKYRFSEGRIRSKRRVTPDNKKPSDFTGHL